MQEDAPLVMVRLRVVKLLGHLGGKLNRSLVTGKGSHKQTNLLPPLLVSHMCFTYFSHHRVDRVCFVI